MRTLLPENLCAHRRGAIEELIKGRARDTATQLQILFAKPTGDHDRPEELLVKLLTSVTESLSQVLLSSCEDCECEVTQIPNQVGSLIGDQRLVNSGESCKRPAAEDRRGCYKRRKISEISMEVLSTTNEDGHAWRKYGQTKIPEAQFPMCYFRCIHEFDQGCQATKRVQRIQEAPHMYRTTYFGHHTCRSYLLNNPSQNPLLEAHLRSFSSKTFSDSESHSGSFPTIEISTQYTSSHPSSASFVRNFSSETISTQDSEPYARSFSSEMIPTQYISSCPSFASSVRKECEVGKIMHILHHRRSESLSQFNLLDYCLHPRAKWYESIVGFFGLANILDRMEYVERVDVTEDLRHFIFKELKQKSETANDLETAKKMSSTRGWALWYEGRAELQRWIEGCDFDESLLLWNIATELCFNTDESITRTNHGSGTIATNPNSDDNKKFRHMSKLLSDYMLYLLIVESSMISNLVGIGQTRFRDTCDEAKRFFHTRKIEEPKNSFLDIFIFRKCRFCGNQSDEGQQQSQTSCCKGEKGSEKLKIRACKSVLDVHVAVDPITIKGDSSNSVLFDACMLAKELKKIESKRMWEIISKVWVEMLSYAACSTKANIHAAQLSKGGQLITLVWLLMVHMGLVDVFPDI